ncbi:DNA polymerase III subunit alpha [Achromobacter denitrificans]|uniref:error-prone DNA polymerase n=1 Tax=Achromobacter denitrificans TaxID=32002 RepID=UPI000788B872|nr:error-prone DNA polymerase [Achromobacter denitrificans]OLU07600.1 error-prone DNA polymerase [Achromobacter denitrificans]QKH41479.1 error-prone DNA polymerase [Achromobacter denitrificans]QKH51378.1 error-prone DNA polymerase [Achromobacter denitrificans]CAB3725555.1 Error-prone DNA polymerase [Achromobacter denitrificans]SUU26352.1 DNA polymerase III subunit alpha [Achromobacter denitrificans]
MDDDFPDAVEPASLPAYVELQCQSNFSFLQGASHPEELVARAAELGYAALAITDECSLAGVVRAHVEAKALKLPLLIGSTFQLRAAPDAAPLSLTLLAQTREGYGNLSELITLARTRAPKGEYRLAPDDLTHPPAGYAHLRHLPECLAILSPAYGVDADRMAEQARWLAQAFPHRAWVGLTLLHRSRDDLHRAAVEQAAQAAELPIVALGQVQMHLRSRKPLHDTLTGIRTRQPVSQCGYELSGNAEQHLRTRMRLASLYPPQALAQTLVVARRCAFSLDELRYEYPDEIIPSGHTPATYLRQETQAGAARRFPAGVPPEVASQIEKELNLIADLRYEAYFLTVYDIVQHARSVGILCQGRGSAANSAVCYCLGITEVDPARGNNLFERFISKERNEPPDIDVDFEHQRREEVIQYIYGKYGRHRAALTAVVISYRPRSVLRDTGRALGVDPGVIDAVARAHQWWDGKKEMLRTLGACGLDPESQVARQWASLAQTLMGFPRHLSQHPGGFVISRGKLSRLVPIENAAMEDRSVVQWDKDDLDALGLLKVDVLALGMLSALRRTLELAGQRRGAPLRLQDIPPDDTPTYDMICDADTIGVFQIESRAQMTMLPRLRPREYYDLVVQVAIVRPGPIQGGMVHPYLRRRQGKEDITYPSAKVESVLKRTMGVPIFQEQVMQIAVVAAGFTPGDADQLRRSMAAWKRKGGVDKYRVKLVGGLLAHGYTLDFAEALFRQIEGFGEYGFPESHAASFALLAYSSSWLKRHEPEAFLAALLNSQPMGFYAPAQLVQDARRHGVCVLPPDVTVSGWDSALETLPDGHPDAQRVPHPHAPPADAPRPAVRLGLSLIQGMREDVARCIEDARAAAPFTDTGDLARRAALTRHDLNSLAAGDALRTLAGHRRQASWEAAASVQSRDLLRDAAIVETAAPQLPAPSESQGVAADYRSVGLTLRSHPVALLRPQLAARNFQPAAVLNGYPDKRVARACGIVTVRQRPQTSKGVIFVTLEDETGPVNVVVRPELIERQRRELLGSTLLGVYGSWQNVDGVRHLIAQRLVNLSDLLGGLNTQSRNFH